MTSDNELLRQSLKDLQFAQTYGSQASITDHDMLQMIKKAQEYHEQITGIRPVRHSRRDEMKFYLFGEIFTDGTWKPTTRLRSKIRTNLGLHRHNELEQLPHAHNPHIIQLLTGAHGRHGTAGNVIPIKVDRPAMALPGRAIMHEYDYSTAENQKTMYEDSLTLQELLDYKETIPTIKMEDLLLKREKGYSVKTEQAVDKLISYLSIPGVDPRDARLVYWFTMKVQQPEPEFKTFV